MTARLYVVKVLFFLGVVDVFGKCTQEKLILESMRREGDCARDDKLTILMLITGFESK